MEFISPRLVDISLETFMREALQEAQSAGQAGELPIGAVLVISDEIVSRGRARHNEFKSQIRHAELITLLDGGSQLWQNYSDAILFTTVEPRPMCLGAIVMADVPHVIFGMRDPGVHSSTIVSKNPYIRRHLQTYYGGVLENESVAIFKHYDPKTLAYIQSGTQKG